MSVQLLFAGLDWLQARFRVPLERFLHVLGRFPDVLHVENVDFEGA